MIKGNSWLAWASVWMGAMLCCAAGSAQQLDLKLSMPAAAPVIATAVPANAGPAAVIRGPDFAGERASADARYLAQWVLELGDNRARPFAIVDKKEARIYVFGADARLRGASSVLTGLTPGDTYIPNLNKRNLSQLRGDERTTAAGRFDTQPGRNLQGEDVVWVDYDTAFAIHRLRPAAAKERRPERMASANPADHRISLGCVIVPVAFYESVVAPLLGKVPATVYVMPEDQPVRAMFGAEMVGSR